MIRNVMWHRLGDATLDRDRRVLSRGGQPVHLSPRAYRLLELLVDRSPVAVSRREILDVLWPDVVVSDGSIAVLVNELRNALGDHARSPRWIRTIPAFGYALEGAVHGGEGPPRSARHALVWAGAEIFLATGENFVGRDPACAVVVGHPSVSRRHARIVVSEAGAELTDLGSRNGTFVGAERVGGRRVLLDGDQIVLGSATLTYRGPAASPSLSTATLR